jgi:hypothetical protein
LDNIFAAPDYIFLNTARKALEIAFGNEPMLDGLALEITLHDGLAMVTWVRMGTQRVNSVAGMVIRS